MFAQLNRFMSLLVLCGLLTQPALAAPDGYQTLVVNGDTFGIVPDTRGRLSATATLRF